MRMGKVLFATYPMFREGILELDAIYERVTGSSLVKTTGLLSRMSQRLPKKSQCLPNIYSSKCTCGTLPCLVAH